MRPERRARARPDRKTKMRSDQKARAGTGGPPQKAAPSSRRTPPAQPTAAAVSITVAAAAEERRLRQQNRLTLEEDKPAVERCLEELVFGDVEDDEDALLRRLRGPRVREAPARAERAQAGRAAGGEVLKAEPGRPAAASAQVGGREGALKAGAEGRRFAYPAFPRWTASLGGHRPRLILPGRSHCALYAAGALHVFVLRTVVVIIWGGSALLSVWLAVVVSSLAPVPCQ